MEYVCSFKTSSYCDSHSAGASTSEGQEWGLGSATMMASRHPTTHILLLLLFLPLLFLLLLLPHIPCTLHLDTRGQDV